MAHNMEVTDSSRTSLFVTYHRAQSYGSYITPWLIFKFLFRLAIGLMRGEPCQPAIIRTAASITRSTEGTYSCSNIGALGVGVSGAATRVTGASR